MKQGYVDAAPSFYIFWAVFCLLDEEGVMPLFLLAAVLHELGHIAAIRLCGGQIDRICLRAAGAVLRQGHSLGYVQECIVSLAGPLAGLAGTWVFTALGQPMAAGANLLLTLFNLLPILPLDGGCALRSLCGLLPAPAGERAEHGLQWFSLAASAALTAAGIDLLIQTGQNASVLAAGSFLLYHNIGLLRDPRKYGMIMLE